jgi:hypothetical protein
MKRIFSILLALALVLSFSLMVTTPVAAAILTVNTSLPNTPPNYHTIQAAIAAASPGDTIMVAAGTYAEAVTINKRLTLMGAKAGVDARTRDTSTGESILDGSTLGVVLGGFVVSDAVSNVTIDGFEIRNYSNPSSLGGTAVGIMAFRYSGGGQTAPNTNITILNNYLHDLGWNGVLVGSQNLDLIQSGITVRYNKIAGCPYAGIELTNTVNSQVRDNAITAPTFLVEDPGDAGVGIEIATRAHTGNTVVAGTNVLVEGNTITGTFPAGTPGQPTCGSRAGINLLSRTYSATSSATLTGVTVRGNTVSGGTNVRAGVLVVAESRLNGPATITNLVIQNNVLDGNKKNIEIQDYIKTGTGPATHSNISITGNEIKNSTGLGYGVHILSNTSATGIVINFNNIFGNTAWGANNAGTGTLNATYNWWGADDGPSGAGPGSGDAVSANVLFVPWACQPTTGGQAYFTPSAGVIDDLTPVSTPPNPPATFPYGMFTFKITGLSTGQEVTLTIELPGPVPVGTKWWKYHNNTWSPMDIGDDDGDNVITVALKDGRTPDDEDLVNGQITDQGGPASPTVGWETYPVSKVRVLLPWIALLAALMLAASLLVLRHRQTKT